MDLYALQQQGDQTGMEAYCGKVYVKKQLTKIQKTQITYITHQHNKNK